MKNEKLAIVEGKQFVAKGHWQERNRIQTSIAKCRVQSFSNRVLPGLAEEDIQRQLCQLKLRSKNTQKGTSW